MISESQIQEAVRRLVESAQARKVILFGSYARGNARDHSDLDFMVIERDVKDRHTEMTRLHDVLSPLCGPVDVIVVSEDKFDYWSDTPNTIYYEAKQEGKVDYDDETSRTSTLATA